MTWNIIAGGVFLVISILFILCIMYLIVSEDVQMPVFPRVFLCVVCFGCCILSGIMSNVCCKEVVGDQPVKKEVIVTTSDTLTITLNGDTISKFVIINKEK